MTIRPRPFNPLEKAHIAESVARVLLNQPVGPLPPETFLGAGIYAIYYCGDYEAYRPIAEANGAGAWRLPIYVGRAQPDGARKGLVGLGDSDPRPKLFNRLRDHSKSIEAAENLAIDDFAVRYLVVEDIWIALGESLLLSWFKPVWNGVVDGFGNHAPGSGRAAGARPLWDTLHPGRGWAAGLPASEASVEAIERRIAEHLSVDLPPQEGAPDLAIVDLMAAEY